MLGRVFMGRYETVRQLGEGGMGRVYLARQLDLGRQVVVKVMHDHVAADPLFRDRFTRETLLMARFQHPYAVTLYDASVNDPQGPCIVMEYIRGVTLDTLLHTNRRLSAARCGRLLYQLCEVLQAAHNEGIVHRDLKPANLMIVDPDTPYELLKVMDFGLAKLLAPAPFNNLTATNTEFAVGTPGYMCPEQARGEDMDGRGDLYSVGIILYELLTGRLPFAGQATMDVLLAHATEPPPSFDASGGSGVSAAIEAVVLKCLAKDPNQRPRHARELAELYEEALGRELGMTPSPTSVSSQTPVGTAPSNSLPRVALSGQTTPPATAVSPVADALAVVHHLEAWMPEKIAAYKLRGFVNDVGGEVVESVPGRIAVRLGGRGSVYAVPRAGGTLSWLGLGRRSGAIDVELRLTRTDPQRENQLHITVVFRSSNTDLNADLAWRKLCTQIFCDLRGYLMGQTGAVSDAAV
ncbi:MAG TPA: serine/threonine-protein kinase [Gemmataceae bacterium]|nr:serine/threonine-protein kinase [Gemmataceae bacterium]